MTPLQMYLLRSGGQRRDGPDDMRTRIDPTNARRAYDPGFGMNLGTAVRALVPGAGWATGASKIAAGVNPFGGSWGVVGGPLTPMPGRQIPGMSEADSDRAHAAWRALNNSATALNAAGRGPGGGSGAFGGQRGGFDRGNRSGFGGGY